MTVANFRYNHMTAPWDAPLSFGVQAFIEYNGLIMNNRYLSDLIRVTSITGLDDADVRDSREVRASEHGEFAYDSFYGGRTLTLSGFIEAGSLAAVEVLKKNLKAAFAPLMESQLKFRWFDIEDNFDDSKTVYEYNPEASIISGNYTPFIGSINKLSVENGFLYFPFGGTIYVIRASEKRTYCDYIGTLEITLGTESAANSMAIIGPIKDENNYIKFVYEQTPSKSIAIESVVGGVTNELKKVALNPEFEPNSGDIFWLRSRKEGNTLTVEYWNTKPNENSLPQQYLSYVLTGEEESLFGDKILSQVGFGGTQSSTTWRIGNFKIESLYPGDIEFKARKISPVSIKDEQTSLSKFKRSFQIVLKTSDFRAFSSSQNRKYITPSSSISTPILGRRYKRKYPLSYRFFTSVSIPLEENILSINNRGNVFTDSLIYLYGPGEDIAIGNLMNSQVFEWNGSVSENDYIIIDSKRETIVNSIGENYLEKMSASSSWIRLEPMWNDIFIQGSKFGEKTKMALYCRGAHI